MTTVAADAFSWLRDNRDSWDVIILDMPDPDTPETAKLYSLEFIQHCEREDFKGYHPRNVVQPLT